MSSPISIPAGRLKSVIRDWEFGGGWTRVPLLEIAFNNRLTPLARLLWVWLSSIPSETTSTSWAQCETVLGCSTKARRSCMAQLVEQDLITVSSDGCVILNDPFEVFRGKINKPSKAFPAFQGESAALVVAQARTEEIVERVVSKPAPIVLTQPDPEVIEVKVEPVSEKPAPKKTRATLASQLGDEIVEIWNMCKPDGYSKLRTVSVKQKECISRHMKNLNLGKDDVKDFICAVCSGLHKYEFWSSTLSKEYRKFNTVFGYGNPQDKKMKNIENLYFAGLEEDVDITVDETVQYSADEHELIDAFKFVKMNLGTAKDSQNSHLLEKYQMKYDDILNRLYNAGINPEDI